MQGGRETEGGESLRPRGYRTVLARPRKNPRPEAVIRGMPHERTVPAPALPPGLVPDCGLPGGVQT